MFAEACRRASEFTRPVVISTRHQSGDVRTECGTFTIINRDGWFVTAGHLYDSMVKYQGDQNKIAEINSLNENRADEPGAPSGKIKLDPEFITNHSMWWGWDGTRVEEVFVNRQVDIAVGKLAGFNPSWVSEYPVLKDPESLRPGTSVCRMGFPFVGIKSSFDESKGMFRIPSIPSKEVVFPNDGMHTRTVNQGRTADGKFECLYVETSTPGLKGQSGGPIFDRDGHLYAVQVQTRHIPLDLHPTAVYDGQTMVENQFMNVGLGVHIKTVRAVLDDRGVRYDAEGDEDGFRITG